MHQSLLHEKTTAVPTSTRLCNILLFNHTVSHSRGAAVTTHHKYILVIPSSLPPRWAKTIILQLLLCKGYTATSAQAGQAPSLRGLIGQLSQLLSYWLLHLKSSLNWWKMKAQVNPRLH